MGSRPAQRQRLSAIRTILQAGARSAATRAVPAALARNISAVTGGSPEQHNTTGGARAEVRVVLEGYRCCVDLIPGAEAAVETARRHGRRGPVERARGAGRISRRLAVGFVFRRGSFARRGCLSFSPLLAPSPRLHRPALPGLSRRAPPPRSVGR